MQQVSVEDIMDECDEELHEDDIYIRVKFIAKHNLYIIMVFKVL